MTGIIFLHKGGIPPALKLIPTSVLESVVFEVFAEAIPPIKRPRSQFRKQPVALHVGKSSDYAHCRRHLHR